MEQIFITNKFTLVPIIADNGHGEEAHCSTKDMSLILGRFFPLSDAETIYSIPVLNSKALLIYALPNNILFEGNNRLLYLPLAYKLLKELKEIPEHNKAIIHIVKYDYERHKNKTGYYLLHTALQEGDKFIMLNTYDIQNFNTAVYYILLSLKNSQINPSQTAILSLSALNSDECTLLKNYFKTVIVNDIDKDEEIDIINF